mgnify:FL=1
MAKYDIIYACGHEGVVNIIGPHKDREWKLEREKEKICPECWRKHIEEERRRENEEAAKKAKEMELPELSGTPKQVAWAITLRQKLVDVLDGLDEVKDEDIDRFLGVTREELKQIMHYILETKTSAKYFIDNRYEDIEFYVRTEKHAALKSDEEKAREKFEKEEIEREKAAATVYPENKETNAVAEINFNKDEVTVLFERNEKFRRLVRGLGYRWTGEVWRRKITYKTGSAEDRAAELGNKLLNAGFPIRIYDENVRQSAVSGKFEPEHKRWIGKLVDKNRFAFSWSDGKDWYRNVRSLPGSKWENPFVTVSVEHYREVQEFAELYDFKFTPSAIEMIERHKKAMQQSEVVKPAEVTEKSGKRRIIR